MWASLWAMFLAGPTQVGRMLNVGSIILWSLHCVSLGKWAELLACIHSFCLCSRPWIWLVSLFTCYFSYVWDYNIITFFSSIPFLTPNPLLYSSWLYFKFMTSFVINCYTCIHICICIYIHKYNWFSTHHVIFKLLPWLPCSDRLLPGTMN